MLQQFHSKVSISTVKYEPIVIIHSEMISTPSCSGCIFRFNFASFDASSNRCFSQSSTHFLRRSICISNQFFHVRPIDFIASRNAAGCDRRISSAEKLYSSSSLLPFMQISFVFFGINGGIPKSSSGYPTSLHHNYSIGFVYCSFRRVILMKICKPHVCGTVLANNLV